MSDSIFKHTLAKLECTPSDTLFLHRDAKPLSCMYGPPDSAGPFCGSWCPAFNVVEERIKTGEIERTEHGNIPKMKSVYFVTICTGQQYVAEMEK